MTDAKLSASNIAENDHAEYSGSTDYAIGDYCISITTHTIYRALVVNGPSSTATDPDDEAANFADPLVDTSSTTRYWQIMGATNRWKLFDEKPSVQASNSESIVVTIEPSEIISAVALVNINAGSVGIVMTDPTEGEVYNEVIDTIDNSNITDAYEYYFAPFDRLSTVFAYDLPPYSAASIEITITNSGGTAACGQVVVGRARVLGAAMPSNTGFDGYDFSTVATDDFGNLETTRRAATRVGRYNIAVSMTRMETIARIMNELRGGQPAVWSATAEAKIASTIYGYARGWGVDYVDRAANLAYLTIDVQGTV